MEEHQLTPQQIELIQLPPGGRTFLEGPAGAGKTTAAVERMLKLLGEGVPAGSLLLLAPQRTLLRGYLEALNRADTPAGGQVSLVTIGGLAQRMTDLFWPLVGSQAGFGNPDSQPVFLTLETAQYYMARIVRPLLDQGYFASVVIDRNRIFSQILDNLNKAALVGFPHGEIGARLTAAWGGTSGQAGVAGQGRLYADAQECADRFRQYCLANNLLDFSLQIEVFTQHLWRHPLCQEHLLKTYRHLIADNLEEEPPVTHDLLREWLPQFESALLVYDRDAGYRSFLGADPQLAYSLGELCERRVAFEQSLVMGDAMQALEKRLPVSLAAPSRSAELSLAEAGALRPALQAQSGRFYPQMIDQISQHIAWLVNKQGVPPEEIVVLAPYLSDALRFALTNRLEQLGVAARSHRPSRPLRDEPAAQCVLTLAALAHPAWQLPAEPGRFDFTYALVQAIEGMDLVRARLLSEIVFRQRQGKTELTAFEQINTEKQERIGYRLGERYDALRAWLEQYRAGEAEALDVFLSRLFGELLSQPGYGFHDDYAAGQVVANLIESVQKFRWAAQGSLDAEGVEIGQEYLTMLQDGVIAAQYLRSWDEGEMQAVSLSPAYTFLLRNRPVRVQFWLDIGSRGWFERLFQPLTQPYVLSRNWPPEALWGDAEELQAGQQLLQRLTLGLTRRCRQSVVLCYSELGEQGYEQRGQLLYAAQGLLQALHQELDDE